MSSQKIIPSNWYNSESFWRRPRKAEKGDGPTALLFFPTNQSVEIPPITMAQNTPDPHRICASSRMLPGRLIKHVLLVGNL
jgi:hypothetical protein